MNELSVVLEPKASRLPAPSTPDPANSAARATRPLKWKMLDGSSPAPAWLWLPFLSSHGIGYGSSLPPTGARMTPPRWAVPAVAHPASVGAPIEAATSAAPRSRSRRPAGLTHSCFSGLQGMCAPFLCESLAQRKRSSRDQLELGEEGKVLGETRGPASFRCRV